MTTDDLGRIVWEQVWRVKDFPSSVQWDRLTQSAKQPYIRAALAIRDLEQKGIS